MAALVLALFVSSVHISVDQAGGLSANQIRMAIGQVQKIWETLAWR